MDYEIQDLLGIGGFGLVYRAQEGALQRTVAIKEYLPSSLAMRQEGSDVTVRAPQHAEPFALGLKSFVNEARLLARFDHPSLVKVYRFWEAQGTAYMVMPCYEGPTLYDARRAMTGPPDEAWLRALMDPLLGALDCLHREQVFHRDVAPDNILLVSDPDAPCGIRPVLLDFGAARHVISQNSQALTAILKPSFAPIEQYAETTQLRQGPWTDLYALAAVLHYCITGRTPVPATARAVYDDLPSLQQMAGALAQDFGRTYSPALLATIDRALSVKPDERPASASAWRELLQADEGPVQPSAQREVWKERTIMVGRSGGNHGHPAEAFTTTHSLSAKHRAVHPLPETAPDAGPWPRSLMWAAGLTVLSAIIALSSWTVNRRAVSPEAAQAIDTPPVVTAAAPDRVQQVVGTVRRADPVPAPAGGQRNTDSSEVILADSASTAEELRRASERARAEPDTPPRSQRPAPSEATQEAPTEPRRPAREARNPRLACGDRNFIAMAICMKSHCERDLYARHPECTRMRQLEEAQKPRFP